MTQVAHQAVSDKTAIRPFHVNVPESEVTELRGRISAAKWPEQETVADQSQGVQLATMQKLAGYWAKKYGWRKIEARLNALPQFVTNIDGLDIHFIQFSSKHPDALPLIVTQGWPGSVIEPLKIIDPLTNLTAHGGIAADAIERVTQGCGGTSCASANTPKYLVEPQASCEIGDVVTPLASSTSSAMAIRSTL